MKRIGSMAVAAILILGLAVFFVSCGGGGGGGGSSEPGNTLISTPAQGAQSAAAAVRTFGSMSSVGILMTDMASFGVPAPKIKIMSVAGSASTAADKFAARFAPTAKRAAAMRASATGYPMTISCVDGSTVASGTNNSMTMDVDASGTSMSMTYNSCKQGSTLTDGTMIMSGSQNSNSATISIGTSARPYVQTTYANSTSVVVNELTAAVVTVAISATNQSPQTQSVSMTANGYFEDVDYVAHTHEIQMVNNFSFAGTLTDSAEMIGGISYDVATLTLNGSLTRTTYASDTDSTVSYQEGPDTFRNLVVVDKHPSFGTGDEYFSISGRMSISAIPADRCIDGTFSIQTNTPIQIDEVTGQTKAGQMTINGNVIATFNNDGSVSVSLDGGGAVVYSQADLESMCAL